MSVLFVMLCSGTAYGADLSAAQQQAAASEFEDIRQRVDALVLAELNQENIPAFTLAVVKNGRLIVRRGYGFSDMDAQHPATPQTIFGLASLTKTFTAFVLLSLVDEGKVALDSRLDTYIKGLPASYQKLTIRQLASMTAGVPPTVPREVDWRHQLPILTSVPLAFEPGTNHVYSNFSYRLLGTVIENVTGRRYLDMVNERILSPFHMASTGTTVSLARTGMVAQAYGDNRGNGSLHPVQYKNPEISFSAGMLASTIDDLVNYVLALMTQKGLSQTAYQTLLYDRPPLASGEPVPWAFGWASNAAPRFGGARMVSMNGGTPGVASTIIMFPDQQNAVIALSNVQKQSAHAIAHKVAALVFSPE